MWLRKGEVKWRVCEGIGWMRRWQGREMGNVGGGEEGRVKRCRWERGARACESKREIEEEGEEVYNGKV